LVPHLQVLETPIILTMSKVEIEDMLYHHLLLQI